MKRWRLHNTGSFTIQQQDMRNHVHYGVLEERYACFAACAVDAAHLRLRASPTVTGQAVEGHTRQLVTVKWEVSINLHQVKPQRRILHGTLCRTGKA